MMTIMEDNCNALTTFIVLLVKYVVAIFIMALIMNCDNCDNGDDVNDDIHLFVKHCSSEDKILPRAKCWLL